ncbi:AbrB/MazE/SpoVT family DNA-binding domain-containing protein [Natronomonas sp. EA1]|uniref:AbrB/MazE/SpoVT family DNA-binding domain-containing protein n=1 Tax=Natronomonas sp. EA1 TaxID=3421655 RepID=UPI003EB9C093
MVERTLDERGRVTVPREFRERFGDHYHLVEVRDGLKLIPISDDPLAALREEFADVENSVQRLRGDAREGGLDLAGR